MKGFNYFVEFILKWEGGLVDDPSDAGGLTKYGISSRSYPDLDIRKLTKEKAKEIYKRDYWDKIKGHSIIEPVNFLVFDFAVNAGIKQAIICLQKAVVKLGGTIKVDGIIGPKTISSANLNNAELLSSYFIVERIRFYNSIVRKGNNIKFLRGWINRTIESFEEALKCF